MTKYNQSFKHQVIEFYLQNGKNRSLTRQHFQLAENTLRRWIKQYNYNGFNGLAILSKKRIYSLEFKLSIVQAVKTDNFPQKMPIFILELQIRALSANGCKPLINRV